MKTILVPVGGGSRTDAAVFETALAAATPLGAHLVFLHVRMHAAEAASNTPHVAYARGAALKNALDQLTRQCETRAFAAEEGVFEFCRSRGIEIRERPFVTGTVTAEWRSETGDALARLLFHSRHTDLTIMARAADIDGLPEERLERLLIQSGRPLLLVGSGAHKPLLRTVMVCWKEAPQAARAVSVALPLLCKAERVVVASVNDAADPADASVKAIVQELQWHGIEAASRVAAPEGLSTHNRLQRIADECGATLAVMGGYGRGPLREMVFGGCTHAALKAGELPVLLQH